MSDIPSESTIIQSPTGIEQKSLFLLNQDDRVGFCVMEKSGHQADSFVEKNDNGGSKSMELSEVKAEPLEAEEESEFGFVVIKPEMEEPTQSQEDEKKEDEIVTPNVFIIQSPDDMNIEGLDPEVISQVRRVLAESGTDNSVMILNEGNGSYKETNGTSTYVIDLNSVEQPVSAPQSPDTSQPSIKMQQPHQNTIVSTCATTIVSSSSSSSLSSSSSSAFKPLVSTSDTSASYILNQLVSLSNTSHQSTLESSSNTNRTIESFSTDTSSSSTNSTSIVTCPNALPKNLSPLSPLGNKSPSYPGPSTPSSLTSSATVATSQVAEQLMHIAKRMIEDSSQGSQNISVDESQGKIVISSPESKRPGEKSSSESVITMYLSSPNDLTMKLKKLKTNSPVIVMQAGEELSMTEENKENPLLISSVDSDEMKVDKKPVTSQDSDQANQRSDGLAAALSSLASGGVLYRCSECGYSSHNKHYYKQHVDLVHNEERPYKCPHCDYAGKRRHALLEHMVVHSNQRPYTCSHCNASFRKKGHLTNHVKLHMSHRLVHCGVCNIQLPDAEAFESHLRKIHNTDKLYKCKLCEHTVVDRRAMLTHLATHNETIVFSCPNCHSYYNEESSLLTHMKDAHNIIRKSANPDQGISSDLSGKTTQTPVQNKNAINASGSDSKARPANIVCSACGFICADTQVMKKHMWIHIDSTSESGVQLKDQATSKKSEGEKGSNSAMGVLKMNVVSGMKSLPENIVYQCTSCQFTSSDNSVFIKHMLLHKTQRKQQVPATKAPPILSQPVTSKALLESKPVTPGLNVTTVGSSPAGKLTPKEKKSDSSVPFVFDQDSGRYRCLICGYHCDFQRTIKAHIWKHSGNQNIEYPVFEQVSKPEASISVNADLVNKVVPKSDSVAKNFEATAPETPKLPSQPRVVNPGASGNVLTLPFIPPNCRLNFGSRQAAQPSGRMLETSPDSGQESQLEKMGVTTLLKESVVSTRCEEEYEAKPTSSTTSMGPASPPTLIIEEKSEVAIEVSHQSDGDETEKTHVVPINEEDQSVTKIKRSPLFEGCTEPSVVVEIVDSVPPSLGLTGMKSQQGSPRVSDLEGSGNEAKFHKEMMELKNEGEDIKVSVVKYDVDLESLSKSKYDLRKPKEPVKSESAASKLKRGLPTTKTAALKSDGVVLDHRIVDSLKCNAVKKLMTESKGDLEAYVKEEVSDLFSNEESDGTTSSDETVSAGEGNSSTNPPKSGICSSLLAVIEQLRERSRSESERDQPMFKELPKRSGKRSKKSNTATETASLSEFHNIEKISEGGGEKFRCSLCHYTSQRICNMKIHMKTHRQKKPSECSLCDFASASPELLQEHMLQHCKVRTYACKFCPQSFNHKSTLRAHMRAHKDHEPFLCAYCVFETTNPNEYREHMHVHSGCSSRLRCPGCDHIMNSKDELTPHLMKCKGKPPTPSSSTVTGGKSDETKPMEPARSPKSKDSNSNDAKNPQSLSPLSSLLTQHSCVVSGCAFSSVSLKELQDHLSVHCNPSLMVCDLCDFKALHSRSLKSHMKRHANDQRYVSQPLEQYKCNLCGYVCHHLPSLKSHMWRHASDQSYSYEFTNDVINAAIDHDSRVDVNKSQPDDPELLVQFINSESRIMEGELTNYGKGDGQRPTCWVTFRCCSCGFETINKAKLNIHMRSHSDIIQQTLDSAPRKPGVDKSNHLVAKSQIPLAPKPGSRRSLSTDENNEPSVPLKVRKAM